MTKVAHDHRRQFAIDVLRSLRDAGFEAYWAGGCVRDHLLGIAAKDFDVATNAKPDEVRRLFGRRRTLAVGAAFGVIVVLGPRGAGQVEVTTFRHDGRYSDGRHPDSVTFGTAEEDVRRRDFTINGMLYDPLADRVLDWVGGQQDLREGIVRAIGDPRQRFDEDKLRMLRAVRFAARFGFRLDEATREAIRSMAGQITVVAAERIAQEMRAVLVHPTRAEGIDLCRQVGLLAVVLPEVDEMARWALEVQRPMANVQRPTSNVQRQATDGSGAPISQWPEACGPKAGALAHTLAVLRQLAEPSFPLALAALLHAVRPATGEAAEVAEAVGRRWRLSNEEIDRAVWLVRRHQDLRQARAMPWPRLQRLLTTEGIDELLDLHSADLAALGRDIAPVTYCRQLLERPPADLNPPPLITGHDLIRHGVPRGKVYQALLERVRDAQLEGGVDNAEAALALVDRLLAAGDVAPSPHVWRD
jgi:tRNA nucleotidyltransferase/poly(A) polymerase